MTNTLFGRFLGAVKKRKLLATKFLSVMEFYREARGNFNSYGSIDYTDDTSSSSCVVGKVQMSAMDFVADVDIAAKRELGPNQLAFFKRVYAKGTGTKTQNTSDTYKMLDAEVIEIMGQAFLDRGISPEGEYMRSVKVA